MVANLCDPLLTLSLLSSCPTNPSVSTFVLCMPFEKVWDRRQSGISLRQSALYLHKLLLAQESVIHKFLLKIAQKVVLNFKLEDLLLYLD